MTPILKAQFRERLTRDLAESLRQNIAAHRTRSGQIDLQATVSLGLAGCIPDHQTPPEHLISLADKALYQAKTAGHNQVRYDDQSHPVQAGSPGDTDGGNVIHLGASPGISANKGLRPERLSPGENNG